MWSTVLNVSASGLCTQTQTQHTQHTNRFTRNEFALVLLFLRAYAVNYRPINGATGCAESTPHAARRAKTRRVADSLLITFASVARDRDQSASEESDENYDAVHTGRHVDTHAHTYD